MRLADRASVTNYGNWEESLSVWISVVPASVLEILATSRIRSGKGLPFAATAVKHWN